MRPAFLCLLLALLLSACVVAPAGAPAATPTEVDFAAQAEEMARTQIEARDVQNPEVLAAMRTVPRHQFVPAEFLDQAYADHPLPIGHGQTISQPYIVALMTEALDPQPGQRVLEIGTGSGYQAAVLAHLGIETYTVEIIPELAELAEQRLAALGYDHVHVRQADGYFGWEEHAPFDAVIVTAAPDHLPTPLIDQLADGGRLVIPIGPAGSYQTLWRFERHGNELLATNLGGVSFVPFTGAGVE
jgi:protein-L-isoaspartate(D-aspartate) O-methyltransferase